jgi:hypothetical protein
MHLYASYVCCRRTHSIEHIAASGEDYLSLAAVYITGAEEARAEAAELSANCSANYSVVPTVSSDSPPNGASLQSTAVPASAAAAAAAVAADTAAAAALDAAEAAEHARQCTALQPRPARARTLYARRVLQRAVAPLALVSPEERAFAIELPHASLGDLYCDLLAEVINALTAVTAVDLRDNRRVTSLASHFQTGFSTYLFEMCDELYRVTVDYCGVAGEVKLTCAAYRKLNCSVCITEFYEHIHCR